MTAPVVAFEEDRADQCACSELKLRDPGGEPVEVIPDPVDDRFLHGRLLCFLLDEEVGS